MQDRTQKQNTNEPKRYQKIGVLWKRQTTDNRGYLSGRITMIDEFGMSKDYPISVWPNDKKAPGDKNPDYKIDLDTQGVRPTPSFDKRSAAVASSPPQADVDSSQAATPPKAEPLI